MLQKFAIYWWAKTPKDILKDIIILWLKDVITKKVYIVSFPEQIVPEIIFYE